MIFWLSKEKKILKSNNIVDFKICDKARELKLKEMWKLKRGNYNLITQEIKRCKRKKNSLKYTVKTILLHFLF